MKSIVRSLLLGSALHVSGLLGAVAVLGMAAPAVATAGEETPARLAFVRGEQLYSSGQYAAALAAFEDGYRQTTNPAFLFDIGHTYRAMGNPQRAIEYYRAYLVAQPRANDRSAIEAAIVQEQSKLAAATPPSAPTAAPIVAAKLAPPPSLAATPAPVAKPAPVVVAAVAKPAPVVVAPTVAVVATPTPAATPTVELAATPPALSKEPATVPAKVEGRPFYKSWWFWTATGVAVSAAAIGLGVGLSQSSTDPAKEVIWR
jgi:hypothetical protein